MTFGRFIVQIAQMTFSFAMLAALFSFIHSFSSNDEAGSYWQEQDHGCFWKMTQFAQTLSHFNQITPNPKFT